MELRSGTALAQRLLLLEPVVDEAEDTNDEGAMIHGRISLSLFSAKRRRQQNLKHDS
jgi:hypothetical protein